MTPEAMTRAERTSAAVAHGGSLRLLRFLGASAVVHVLLAVVLLRESAPKESPLPSVSQKAVVWFESPASAPSSPAAPSVGGPPALAAAAAPRSRTAPVRRAPMDPPAAPELAVQPPLVEPSPASMEVAPGSQSSVAQGEAGATKPEGVGAGSPEGVAAAPGGVGSHGAAAPGSGGAAASAGAPELKAYARRLYQVVGRQRRYPASAARFGMEGTARIHLSINREGSLAGVPRLVRSSGYEVLDAEALRMVEAAAPFAPLPEGHARPSAEFVIPVDFSLRTPG